MLNLAKNLYAVFTSEQRKHFRWLQVLFCFAAAAQVVGVASLAPFIAMLSDQQLIHSNRAANWLFQLVGTETETQFLVVFAFLVMIAILLSNVIAGATTALTFWFSLMLGTELQRSIYRSYLHKEYVFFSRKNSADLVSVLTQEVPRFIFMVVQPFLNLASQLFVLLIIAAGLLYLDPVLALTAMMVVGGGYFLTYRIVRERLTQHGERIWKANNLKVRLLNESLGGIKEVKLLATESFYEKRVDEANTSWLRSGTIIGLFGDLPKYVLESVAFCALLGLAAYLLARHGSSKEIVAILSLYAMAGYKLLPATQQIFKAFSQIKANGAVLYELLPDVTEGRNVKAPASTDSRDFNPGDIELMNVSYRYPGSTSDALRDISLTIRQGTIFALVGPSGAGKSTLADVILGMLQPTSGTIKVGNVVLGEHNLRSWQKHLGYVPQNIFLTDDTLLANISFGTHSQPDPRKIVAAARMANIDSFIDGLAGTYDYVVGERGALLSGGQKQRIGIARALYHDAHVLVLDEATSALDSLTEKDVMGTIADLKATKTILMIAHRLSTIKCADYIAFVNDGRIEDVGTFEELNQRNSDFRKMVVASSDVDQAGFD